MKETVRTVSVSGAAGLPAEVDVVVVGSGAAGMSAAITAAAAGLKVVIVEKSQRWGGTTSRSGGGVWIPGNEVLAAKGPADSTSDARTYLHSLVGDDVPAELIDAYLEHGPETIAFLNRNSALDLEWVRGYSDYFPEAPGGRASGRSCEPKPFDVRTIGDDFTTMEPFYTPTPLNVVVKQSDYRWLSTGLRRWRGPVRMMAVGARTFAAKARGRRLVGLGNALVASLMVGLQRHGVPIHLGVALSGLITDAEGAVLGARVTGSDGEHEVIARRGVILACGGFDHDPALRAQHHRAPAGPDLSLGVVTNSGDGLRAATAVGADTALLDDAWWAPSIPLPRGPWFALAERSLPRSIIVNKRGERFMNESLPYVEATHAMFGGEHGVGPGAAENLPAWLVFDQTYRNRYLFAGKPARSPLPKKWFDSGALVKADTVAELAERLGLSEGALTATVDRFNGFARDGVDSDFHRGESAYDHYYGDTSNKPNPSLGEISTGPFYAAAIVPADLGTKGGVRIDVRARVLRDDDSVIDGLYAAGNVAAPVMGHTYAGPGATIGPAMVFGRVAALDAASR
ncbi:3-oxosteroid 1-dehydrogenase [Gordonia sp. PDNC005]|uniref:3-oxosteroid 1-dehydrogenase n=1 Tax=Gordonia sp. PDNC005 TaxID=2811424 RepID=UPI001962AD9F|nr:3-oxosteroid 1-dehydrogenase [Gordonia sp. PDNC005]QRY63375.1 3-oxosteroid 1-dehydrogenase [Gordonia sp. PDNC005]